MHLEIGGQTSYILVFTPEWLVFLDVHIYPKYDNTLRIRPSPIWMCIYRENPPMGAMRMRYFWVRNSSPTGDSVDFVLANDSIRHRVVQLLFVFHHHGVSLEPREFEHQNFNVCSYDKGNVCTWSMEGKKTIIISIWTNEEAEVERVWEKEKRRKKKRRERKKEDQRRERVKEKQDARKGRTVAKHCVFFPLLRGSGRPMITVVLRDGYEHRKLKP